VSARDNISPSQFPDHVPDLQRPDVTGQDRIFLLDRPYGGGSDQPRKVTDSWRASGTKFQSVAGYAPTADDFKDMGPARQEGSISIGAQAKAHVDAALGNFGGPLYWLREQKTGPASVSELSEEQSAVVRRGKLPLRPHPSEPMGIVVDAEGRRHA